MNKPLLFFIAFFLRGGLAFAQQVDNYRQDTTTLYQRAKGFSQDLLRSKWRQEIKKEGELFVLNLYDKKDMLKERISFADRNLLERKGQYVLYNDLNVKEEGNYEKGYKVGEWKYYHQNNRLSEKRNYVWDKLNGSNLLYWDNGQLKASKNYVNGVRKGEWKLFYKDGKLASSEIYTELGELESGNYFDEQGKMVNLDYVTKAGFLR